jgi:hypothetical protein
VIRDFTMGFGLTPGTAFSSVHDWIIKHALFMSATLNRVDALSKMSVYRLTQ